MNKTLCVCVLRKTVVGICWKLNSLKYKNKKVLSHLNLAACCVKYRYVSLHVFATHNPSIFLLLLPLFGSSPFKFLFTADAFWVVIKNNFFFLLRKREDEKHVLVVERAGDDDSDDKRELKFLIVMCRIFASRSKFCLQFFDHII